MYFRDSFIRISRKWLICIKLHVCLPVYTNIYTAVNYIKEAFASYVFRSGFWHLKVISLQNHSLESQTVFGHDLGCQNREIPHKYYSKAYALSHHITDKQVKHGSLFQHSEYNENRFVGQLKVFRTVPLQA